MDAEILPGKIMVTNFTKTSTVTPSSLSIMFKVDIY